MCLVMSSLLGGAESACRKRTSGGCGQKLWYGSLSAFAETGGLRCALPGPAPSVCTPSREASAGTGSDESPVTTLTRPGRVLLTIAGYVCPQELVCTTVARRERNCLKSRTTRLQEPWLKNFEPVRTGVVRWHLGPAGAGAVCEPTTASSHRSVLDGQGPEARRGRG